MSGSNACAGCGPSIAMHMILRALGKETVVVNATGCMEVVSTQYPDSVWNVPYIHSVFENIPAVATGVSRAFKVLNKKGTVVAIGGDGASYDIGFGAMSGAMERNENMIYVVYDNNAYMNTGIQRSGGTPWGAATTTSPKEVGGKKVWQKPLPFIAAAHAIPYVATASIAYPNDLDAKLKKAKEIEGFKYIHIHTPCPVGWKFASNKTIEIARDAVECGLWNLFEIENGKFKFSFKPQLVPVDKYLKEQGRFKHLTDEGIAFIQEHVKKARGQLEKLENANINERLLF